MEACCFQVIEAFDPEIALCSVLVLLGGFVLVEGSKGTSEMAHASSC